MALAKGPQREPTIVNSLTTATARFSSPCEATVDFKTRVPRCLVATIGCIRLLPVPVASMGSRYTLLNCPYLKAEFSKVSLKLNRSHSLKVPFQQFGETNHLPVTILGIFDQKLLIFSDYCCNCYQLLG